MQLLYFQWQYIFFHTSLHLQPSAGDTDQRLGGNHIKEHRSHFCVKQCFQLHIVAYILTIIYNQKLFVSISPCSLTALAFLIVTYRKVPKFSDARKLCCNQPKIQTKRPNCRIFCQKDANGIANSEDPDQTGSALFAKAFLSKN